MREKTRQKIRRAAAGILTGAVLLTGAFPALAAEADLIPVDLDIALNTSTGESTQVEIFWSDEWFSEPSTEYNHELAITSVAFSAASYLVYPGDDSQESEIRQALTECGFDADSIIFCNYDYPYTEDDNDVVACIFAAEETDNGALVMIIVRGTSDSMEWYSDFRVSADEDYDNVEEHYGFYEAEKNLAADLNDYLAALAGTNEAFNSENVKFYTTGHSRGGAVANILASELDDTYGKDRVYAYTFASPEVSASAGEEGYENIFNITSAEDVMPELTSLQWDLKRFGVNKVIAGSGGYEIREDNDFSAHDVFVYYARMKSGLPETLFE